MTRTVAIWRERTLLFPFSLKNCKHQCGHAQSCIFWNLGVVRLKSPLYYALVISLDVDKAKSIKFKGWGNLPKYLSLKRQISQTSGTVLLPLLCVLAGQISIVLNRSGVWKWLYCSQTGWSEFLLFSSVRWETSAAAWLKQVWFHLVCSQRASVSMGTAW